MLPRALGVNSASPSRLCRYGLSGMPTLASGLILSRSLVFLHGRLKPQKRPGSGASQPCENIVVAYYFCGEPIPYRTLVKGRVVTLGQFKELLTKKGNYR